MATQLRVAKITEVQEVSKLIFYAYKDFAYLICNTEEEDVVMQRMEQLVLHPQSLPVSLDIFRAMVDENDQIVGGFAAYPIAKTLGLSQNLYQALLSYSYFASLDTKVRLSPRLMNILGNDTAWTLPYADAYYLDAFAVHTKFRGQRLAPQMMEYVKMRAKEENCNAIVLLAREDMVQFYSKLHFNTNQFLGEGEEDFFIMHLPLT